MMTISVICKDRSYGYKYKGSDVACINHAKSWVGAGALEVSVSSSDGNIIWRWSTQ